MGVWKGGNHVTTTAALHRRACGFRLRWVGISRPPTLVIFAPNKLYNDVQPNGPPVWPSTLPESGLVGA
eukprot:scaffold4891_cov59-Phaeocystis_antarctica.AAC.2